MKRTTLFLVAALAAISATAQTMDIRQGNVTYSYQLGQAGNMTYSDATTLNVGGRDYTISEIDQIDVTTDGQVSDNTVQVTYSGTSASVVVAGNIAPYMTVSVAGADVSVVADSTLQQEVVYTLSGQTTDGMFYMDGEYKSTLILNGVSIANQDGAAIQVDNGKRINVTLADGTTSTLSDGAGTQKAAFFINGHAEFEGAGTLNIAGYSKHAYRSDEYTQLKNAFTGTINVTASASDAMHVGQYLEVKNGTLSLNTAGGDGIDVEVSSDNTDEKNGQLLIEGGTIDINVTGAACKGLKCDSLMSISGGVINVTTSGNGTVTTDSSGIQDANSAAAAKCGGNFVMSAGQVSLTSTGEGAKGINADGLVTVSDGILTVVTTGDIYEYTANGVEDDSKAHGVKGDGGIVISGGYVYVYASTDKGNPFKSDGSILFNGGTILGAGNKAASVAAASTQYYKSLSAQKLTAGSTYTAGDVTVTVPATYSNSKANVVASSPTMSASGTSQSDLADNNVTITWSGSTATVDVADNIADALTVSNNAGVVSILQSDALANEVTYTLSGNGTGSFYNDGSYKASYVFNSLTLTSSDSAVVNIDNGKRLDITLNGTSTLTDASNGSHKGTLMMNGHSQFSGTGTLVLKGNTKNALWADEYVWLTSGFTGTIKVTGAANDGFNINQYYQQDGGSVVISGVGDDGIAVSATSDTTDEYNGQIFLNGGSANITVTATAAKGIKCDALFTITGGEYTVTTSGGGTYDSSERDAKGCSCLNTDGNMLVSGGTLTLKSTGAGGKCIKVDGTLTQTDGTIVATSTGAQYKYSSYTCSAKAIKADGAINVSGGQMTASASSHEAIESKSTITISGGVVEATSSDDAINAASHFTITGGQVYAYSSGNDGLDANGNFIIKGGTVVARGTSAPECGIDANEEGGYNLYITGGTVVGFGGGNSPVKTSSSIGTGQACLSFSGSVSTTMAISGVLSFNMSALQTAVTAAEMVEALNTQIANTRVMPKMKERPALDLMPMRQDMEMPADRPFGTAPVMRAPGGGGPGGGGPGGGGPGGGGGSGNSWLISSPNLVTGSSYTVLSGCTLSGGTFFHGLSTDASVSGGSTLATATAATTTSSSGGGGGGGGWW